MKNKSVIKKLLTQKEISVILNKLDDDSIENDWLTKDEMEKFNNSLIKAFYKRFGIKL
jgi:hypothetical protein